MNAEEWLSMLRGQNNGDMATHAYSLLGRGDFVGLTQVRPIGVGTDNFFFFIYDVDQLMRQMASQEIYEKGVITLMNRNRGPLYRTREEQPNETYHALYNSDANTGFTVQVQIP
jgi:hypothetical protein